MNWMNVSQGRMVAICPWPNKGTEPDVRNPVPRHIAVPVVGGTGCQTLSERMSRGHVRGQQIARALASISVSLHHTHTHVYLYLYVRAHLSARLMRKCTFTWRNCSYDTNTHARTWLTQCESAVFGPRPRRGGAMNFVDRWVKAAPVRPLAHPRSTRGWTPETGTDARFRFYLPLGRKLQGIKTDSDSFCELKSVSNCSM